MGIRMAAPTIALIALSLNLINVVRYREDIDWHELKRLGWVAVLGVPVGVFAITHLHPYWVEKALGLFLVLYVVYTLIRPTTPNPISQRWSYPAGFLAGCLGGAYNIPGPPLILYGSLRQWPHQRFRAVLQAVFVATTTMVVATHGFYGHYNADVFKLYALALPLLLAGIATAAWLDRRIHPEHLRTLVYLLILVLGAVLLIRQTARQFPHYQQPDIMPTS